MWEIFRKYDHIEVKRLVEQTNDGKKVEIYYQQANLVPIYGDFLREI